MGSHTEILAAIASEGVFSQFEPLVSRSDLRVTRVRSGQHALTLARNLNYELIIGQHPLSDIGFVEFHSSLRSGDCASRRAPLLIITRDDQLDALTEELDDEDAQMFCIDSAPEQVEKALNEILGVAMRVHSRLLLETSLECESTAAQRVFQTVDVSESGLLYRSKSHPPIGSQLRIALHLPESDEPVCGLAEVIRHTRPKVEAVEGNAIRFLRLDEEDRIRLADFIQQKVSAPH